MITRSSMSWEEVMSMHCYMHVCMPRLEIDDEDVKKELERLKSEFEPKTELTKKSSSISLRWLQRRSVPEQLCFLHAGGGTA